MIDVQSLRELMLYEPQSGLLTWRERPRKFFKSDQEWRRWNTRYARTRAFNRNQQGYRDGMILRRTYREHHVVWALHHGDWPAGLVDHINGIRDDNRIENLRVVTRSENARNRRLSAANSSGANGVYRHKERWRATITVSLGTFDTFDEAVAARKLAEAGLGFHPNHGAPAQTIQEYGARHGVDWSKDD